MKFNEEITMFKKSNYIGFVVAAFWLLFTITLTCWWIYLGVTRLEHYQRMVFWEGCTLLLSILLGGSAIFYYLYKELEEGRRLKEFFAAFTHEIKTPLASARLKSEILKEKITDPEGAKLAQRVLQDVGRLSLQLENSLFLADKAHLGTFLEAVDIADSVARLADFWPELKVQFQGDLKVTGDKRVIDAIFANLMQNAVVHGKATEMHISHQPNSKKGKIAITVTDNGVGFSGLRSDLGKLFHRHYTGSGSGIGLFLVKRLMAAIKGSAEFPQVAIGFSVQLTFPN